MTRSDIYRHLNEGLRLWHVDQPFPAHEAWEWVWHRTTAEEKVLAQALVQLAAAWTKYLRGEAVGTNMNLSKARARIATLNAPSLFGLNVPDLRQRIDRLLPFGGDDQPLKALLPTRLTEAGFLYLHGFSSGPSSVKAKQFQNAMEAAGWSIHVPDLNHPQFEDLTLTRAIRQAQQYMFDRTLIIGSSMGGYMASIMANHDPRIRAQVLMAPAFGLAQRLLTSLGEEQAKLWQREGVLIVDHYAYAKKTPIRYTLVEDAQRYPEQPELKVPTYILAGTRDDIVPLDVIEKATYRSGSHVQLDIVDDDHSLVNSINRALIAARSLADRYII
ncbi:MAG: alpha/beta fold hydrolase [Myxococcales bacterium]|nr:alpha/beta fold hydrolase [Myxococcales bacterium]